jgi:hypothetical protein
MLLNFEQLKDDPAISAGKRTDPDVKTSGSHSFIKTLEQVMSQVEYNCFADLRFKRIDPLYKELCLIIAEILVLDKDSVIKINGSFICTRLVQEIYSQLNNDHLSLVFKNFNNVSQRIFYKKSYLRKYERLYILKYTPK